MLNQKNQTNTSCAGDCTAQETALPKNEKKIIRRLSTVGIFGNILLSGFKLFAGIFGHSGAMVSDAVHSLSDVFATFIAFLGTHLARRPADREHPYGHERIECVASLVLGLILFVTGIGIGYTGLQNIFGGHISDLQVPSLIALIAAIISIVVKESMFWYTRHYAKLLNSDVFMADAWHHRSDALSSIGSLIGIGGAMLGVPLMDPIASVVICIFILKVAYDILKDALKKMVDTSCDEAYENELREVILSTPDVEGIDLLQTRLFGNKVYVDLEIAVDGDKSLNAAHDIAETVHDMVEKNFTDVKHISVHVNPK